MENQITLSRSHIRVFPDLLRDLNLSVLESVIYSDILGKNHGYKRKWGVSYNDLSQYFNISESTARKSIEHLIEIGYLEITHTFDKRGEKVYEFDTKHKLDM